jgi:predicted site-specific integrase-resolvase
MYKRSEIAELIGISARTLQRLINREKIPIKKKVRLSRRDVEQLEYKLKAQLLRYLR